MLAHKASHEARVAVDAMLGERVVFEPEAIPAVVFTDPEVAWCGLTENDAAKQKREVTVARFPWAASGRAITLDRTDGMTKLVIDPRLAACSASALSDPAPASSSPKASSPSKWARPPPTSSSASTRTRRSPKR